MRRFTSLAPRRALTTAIAAAASAALLVVPATSASATGSTITGTVFDDANRNGVLDAGEAVWADQRVEVFDTSGRYVAGASTDASGTYAIAGLADGSYQVAYSALSWYPLKMDWTPTTTGSWRPSRTVTVAGQARVDFGWRPIVRSTNLDQPIASYRAPDGLTVQTYNDAVAPQEVAQLAASGSLVGVETSSVIIRIDGATSTATGSSYASQNGTYSGYAAIVTIDWRTWINVGENALFHEYGHAWSGYFSVMVQQDPKLTGYLQARGLAGDPRVDTSYGWSRLELVAEDYRQLFGTPVAQAAAQANGELPPAASVPGLRDYLATTFRQAPVAPTPPPATEPVPAPVEVTGLAVSPRPVTKAGKVTYSLSRAASVTVTITTADGAAVRTLKFGAAQGAGGQSVAWDRRDAKGRRVAAGTYTARVAATADGATSSVSVDFPVA